MEYEITSGTVTHYEVLDYLKQYIRTFKQCFKREGRYRLLALRNVENLEIFTHLCDFTNDRMYCDAISYLIRATREKSSLSHEAESLHAERESEWTLFLQQARKLIDDQEDTVNYLTKVSEDFFEGRTNDFPQKGEQRLKLLHNELRRLFLTKKGVLLLENTQKFLAQYYRSEVRVSSGKFFTFTLDSHEPPIPSQGGRQKGS